MFIKKGVCCLMAESRIFRYVLLDFVLCKKAPVFLTGAS